VFQLNNTLWARKCQPQSRHHPRRRRRVCHVRLGTRPWYEAVVRGRGTQAGHRHAAGPARSHSEPAASTKEAQQQGQRSATTGTPT